MQISMIKFKQNKNNLSTKLVQETSYEHAVLK